MLLVERLLELPPVSTLLRLNLLKLRMKEAPKPSIPCTRHCLLRLAQHAQQLQAFSHIES